MLRCSAVRTTSVSRTGKSVGRSAKSPVAWLMMFHVIINGLGILILMRWICASGEEQIRVLSGHGRRSLVQLNRDVNCDLMVY